MKKKLSMLLAALMLVGGTVTAHAEETAPVQNENAVNLTDLGRPIGGEGDKGGYYWLAFDGDLKTACSFLEASKEDSWVGIQLDYPAVLSHIRMATQDMDSDGIPDRTHSIFGMIIEGSNDGESWEQIFEIDNWDMEDYMWLIEDGEDIYYTEQAECETAYTYFRAYNDGSGAPSFAELEFYGVPTKTAEELAPDPSTNTKDGLTAKLTVTENAEDLGRGEVKVALTNESAYISGATVEITLPDALAFDQGEATETVTFGENGTAEVTALIRHSDLKALSEGGNAAVLYIAIAAAVVVLALAVILVARKKKSAAACLLLCGILLGGAAVPVSAATTIRSMTLEDAFTYNGETYPITVTVSYDYTFTETDAKDTSGLEQFEITYYGGLWGENMTDESFIQKIVDAGFTSIPLEWGSPDQLKEALALFRKHGLTCSALRDPRVEAFIPGGTDGTTTATQEEIDRVVAEVVADYADYMDVIKGWLLKDEPNTSYFDLLSKLIAAFRKYSPDKNTMVNLFPTYAASVVGTETYKDYLDQFVEQCDPHYLSYDHYHFLKGGITRPSFFTNLENVREKAQETGIDPMIIILVSKHDDYDDLTYSQLQWEVNTSLTYGMKRISYYTCVISAYTEEDLGYSNGFIRYTGELYPHYYDGQKINEWLLPLGTELYDKNSTAVFHLMEKEYWLEDDCVAYESYGDLGAAVGNEFLIGFFDDCSFMITNKLYTEGEAGENTIELLDVKENLQYFDPMTAEWKDAMADGIAVRNESGNLTITFDAGEGFLLRVVPQK